MVAGWVAKRISSTALLEGGSNCGTNCGSMGRGGAWTVGALGVWEFGSRSGVLSSEREPT